MNRANRLALATKLGGHGTRASLATLCSMQRKLVESDGVLLISSALGTPTNSAIQKYMNEKKVPQLFVSSGATKWNNPRGFPWTIGWLPNYQSEARIYAKYILKEKPNAKIAVLYQNDDYGKDYLKGLKDGLGDKAASMIVAEDAYDITEPTVDSHIVKIKSLMSTCSSISPDRNLLLRLSGSRNRLETTTYS